MLLYYYDIPTGARQTAVACCPLATKKNSGTIRGKEKEGRKDAGRKEGTEQRDGSPFRRWLVLP